MSNDMKKTEALAVTWAEEAPWKGFEVYGLFPDEAAAREGMTELVNKGMLDDGDKWGVLPIYEPEGVINNVESKVEDVGHSMVIVGNFERGFTAFGPFLNQEAAEEWAANEGCHPSTYMSLGSYVRHEMAPAEEYEATSCRREARNRALPARH
jgi:hypothetical protein